MAPGSPRPATSTGSLATGLATTATYNKKPRRLGRGKAALIGVSWDTGGTRVEVMLASALRQAYDALVILHRPRMPEGESGGRPAYSIDLLFTLGGTGQVAEERASLQGHWDGHAISTCLFI